MKKIPEIGGLYKRGVGVWEGYTLEEHTEMMMTQFERYCADGYDSPLLSKKAFRLMASLHDIGKPINPARQHEETLKIMPDVLRKLGLSEREVQVASAVVDQDFIGDYMKASSRVSITEEFAQRVESYIKQKTLQLSIDIGDTVDLKEYFRLISMFYMCDAGSYTVNAGGKQSLDDLFTFNIKPGENKGSMSFSPRSKEAFHLLERQFMEPVSYPDTEVSAETLTDEDISKSIDRYIAWRKEHENEEGVLEPGRAKVLVHSTSPQAAILIMNDGYLRSIYNILTSKDDPRADLMGGGKAQYVAERIKESINNNLELQALVLGNREKILEYFPWLSGEDLNEVQRELRDDVKTVDDLAKFCDNLHVYGWEEGNIIKNWRDTNRYSPWLYLTNLLPVNTRRNIAEQSYAEKYISTTLGHSVIGYSDASRIRNQAAILTDVASFPFSERYRHGGRSDFEPFNEKTWEMVVDNVTKNKSELWASEYRAATEVNILQKDNPQGTAIDIRENTVVLLPASRRGELESTTEDSHNIIWFDDSKFRSVNEAIGWLTTTSEGRSLYNKVKQ